MNLGLREANQHFSKAIKAVRAGREVVLTDRGRPIAVIKPLEKRNVHEIALQAMADENLITRPSQRGRMPRPRWHPVKVKGQPISQSIVDDREEHI
jgi:prevent-host-death family protein